MTPRPQTPYRRNSELLTGHFRQGARYAVWRTHGTGDWLLIYTLAGAGRFGHAVGEITSAPGELVLLSPGKLHDYGSAPAVGRWDLLWCHFEPRPAWLSWLNWPEEAPGLMRLRISDRSSRALIAGRFTDLHRLCNGALRRREAFAMNRLEELLLWCDAENPNSEQSRIDPRVRQAMDYLCRHLDKKVALDDLADAAGLSVSRLAHLFRRQIGTTPGQFFEAQRMTRARQLLELTGQSIKEIAHQVGFDNPFYFTLRFKRQTGLSPRNYRRRRPVPSPDTPDKGGKLYAATVVTVKINR